MQFKKQTVAALALEKYAKMPDLVEEHKEVVHQLWDLLKVITSEKMQVQRDQLGTMKKKIEDLDVRLIKLETKEHDSEEDINQGQIKHRKDSQNAFKHAK